MSVDARVRFNSGRLDHLQRAFDVLIHFPSGPNPEKKVARSGKEKNDIEREKEWIRKGRKQGKKGAGVSVKNEPSLHQIECLA